MQGGRYYPTCITLSDGTAFIAGGLSNLQQWVFSGANWAENDQFETVPPGELFAGTQPQKKLQTVPSSRWRGPSRPRAARQHRT
jgi:hypothetical protein